MLICIVQIFPHKQQCNNVLSFLSISDVLAIEEVEDHYEFLYCMNLEYMPDVFTSELTPLVT